MMTSILSFLPGLQWNGPLRQDLLKLLVAAVLGGFIGLERELKRRPAGLRTNMFICVGAAMFTILSVELAGAFSGDHMRIAAQIIPGIGFIGAGSILHARTGGITGLTTAATIFVVASIGMACGGGLYVLAIISSIAIFVALRLLGWMEQKFSLKQLVMNYIVISERPASDLVSEMHSIMDHLGKELRGLHLGRPGAGKQQLAFSVDATRREHNSILEALRRSESLRNFEVKAGMDFD